MDEGTGQRADGAMNAPATKGNGDLSSERHPIRVLIRDEEAGHLSAHSWMHIPTEASDDTAGHGWKFKVGTAPEGDEGQVYVMNVHRGGNESEINRGSFLRWIDPNDTEGEGIGGAVLYPAGPDDLEAKGFKAGVLKPDASGSWTLEFDDIRG